MSDQLKKYIRAAVEKHWQTSKTAMLASSLGNDLRKNNTPLVVELGGLKLIEFIERDVPEVRVVIHPVDKIVRGLVPAANAEGLTQESLLQLFAAKKSASTPHQRISFHPAVWRAFSADLQVDARRYIFLKQGLHYEDHPPGAVPEGGFEIQRDVISRIASCEASERASAIFREIKHWAGLNGISLAEISNPTLTTRTATSLLDKIISTLADAELASVSMNLRTVKKLRDTQA